MRESGSYVRQEGNAAREVSVSLDVKRAFPFRLYGRR
jgi:hypothetical protein